MRQHTSAYEDARGDDASVLAYAHIAYVSIRHTLRIRGRERRRRERACGAGAV
jgi:hypothetical protein